MAMKVFAAEEVLTASDLNTYCVNVISARKTGSQNIVSSTTLTNDTQLSKAVAANSVYELTGLIKYLANSTAPGLKMQWVGPSGATLSWNAIGLLTTATSQQNIQTFPSAISTAEQFGTLVSATEYVRFSGLLITAATAGNFFLQWAQSTSSTFQTTVQADSFFVLRRID